MENKILILGKNGQVGSALTALLGCNALAAGREEVDLAGADFIPHMERFIGKNPVSTIINAAAYTLVDKAESDSSAAMRVNGSAVGELAIWCKKKNVKLVHYSTDYVFDGSGSNAWRETDTPRPINAYGQSKLAGEEAIRTAGCAHLILRTSWVYDAQAKNFFTTMRRLMREKETLRVVSDQIGAPTYAPHLTKATLAMLNAPAGIYHLCGAGHTSWYGFASAIFDQEKNKPGVICKEILPIPSSNYPMPARRPLNSRLDCDKAKLLGVALPYWEDGLRECFIASGY